MNFKEILNNFFRKYKKQITIKDLIKKLEINRDEIDYLLDTLYELESEGKIILDNESYMYVPENFYLSIGTITKSKSNNYYVKLDDGSMVLFKKDSDLKSGDIIYYSKSKGKHCKQFIGEVKRIIKRESAKIASNYIVKGMLSKNNNFFYITVNDKKIYIPKKNLNGAFVGDVVNVKVKESGSSVIEILEKNHNQHAFRAILRNNELKWVPIGGSYGYFSLDDNDYSVGDLIVAEVNNNCLKVVRKIDGDYNLKNNIEALIIEHGFYKEFPKEVLEQVNNISRDFTEKDLKNRIDLRDLETFTIDPINAKDLDDAVSLEYDDELYYLYVHTANPSNYIKLNSPLFREAMKRCFSVYPSDGVIPMLPDKLSSDLCSLNEDGDKLAITFKIVINKSGNVIDFNVFKSIIHNDKKMNYESVNRFLEDRNNKEYMPFLDTLLKMRELSCILETKKISRGAIEFDNDEKRFLLDKKGNPINIIEKQRGEAEKIIENFMLIANENIAFYAKYLNLPFVYRNHEKPTIQKKINLKSNLEEKGYSIKRIRNIDSPLIFQKMLNNILKGKSTEEKKYIYNDILKTMSRAFYDYQNIGHYGLALDCYATFTSPARKFSDLLNHMIIEEFLDNGYDSKLLEVYREYLEGICEYISSKQKEADDLESEINSLILKTYAANFVDMEVTARILFFNNSGIYIKDENELTGVIPIIKGMILKDNKLVYNGEIYKQNDIIKVRLLKDDNDELIYRLSGNNIKKLAKVKK